MATSPIDLHWSLTTPEVDPSDASDARTYAPSEVAAITDNDYFKITDTYLQFTAPVNGTATSKSTKTRSEFRECQPGTDKELNWLGSGGNHSMGASLVVKHTPNKVDKTEGSLFVGQIHVKNGESPLFKFKYQNEGTTANTGKMIASFRADPAKDADDFNLFPGIAENARIQYYVQVNAAGQLSAYVKVGEVRKDFTGDLSLWLGANASTTYYFKAGVYNNVAATGTVENGNFSQALFYKLTTTHA
jgi:hypothetical protein